MDGKLILEGITAAALIDMIADVVVEKLQGSKNEDVLMTREETAEYLSCGLSTLNRWVNEGRIRCYGIGGRKYFKKSEIEASLELLRIL